MMSNKITRRQLIKTGVAGLCTLTLGRRLPAAEGKRRPNVLIITTDQQRVDAISAVGNKWVKTPNMDSLVANGVYFTKSYCPYPLCSPSRAAVHVSRMPHEIGVDHNSMAIDPKIPISGQIFRDAGYDTGYAGKWHCPEVYPADGFAGYEVLNKTARQGKLAQVVDEATMNAAIEFIRRKREKPFLAIVSFINPHDICLPAGETSPLLEDLWKRYQPPAGAELPPLPANFGDTQDAPEGFTRKARHEAWDENQWRKYIYAYYRMMEDVDRQVGQVLQALRQTGQEEQYDHRVHERSWRRSGVASLDRQDDVLRGRGRRAADRELEGRDTGRADRPRAPGFGTGHAADDLRLRGSEGPGGYARAEPAGDHREAAAAGARVCRVGDGKRPRAELHADGRIGTSIWCSPSTGGQTSEMFFDLERTPAR